MYSSNHSSQQNLAGETNIGPEQIKIMDMMKQIWLLMGLIAVLQNIIPPQLDRILGQWWSFVQDYFNPYCHLDVPAFNGNNGVDYNKLYEDVELYLGSLDAIVDVQRVSMGRPKNSRRVQLALAPFQTVEDCFNRALFWWTHHVQPPSGGHSYDRRSFTLKMRKADKHLLSAYVDHIGNCAEGFGRRNRDRILYTNGGNGYRESWSRGIAFKHPSTFDTLALDPVLKKRILMDLDRFSRAKEFYARVGRSWKRGYLLHGSPGTGKSSLVAAIANYMKYDVYDLELTKVHDNSELRTLLVQTTSKSVIVIEDIDGALDLTDRLHPKPATTDYQGHSSRVTASGLLNFTDGLWSCCGEERIIIYTTNHKDTLDPAFVRCGRMDMHILLSYCAFPAFKILAFNYLRIEDHHLFPAVQEQMTTYGGQMTPADITEILIRHLDDPLEALHAVISALDAKIRDAQLPSPSASDAIAQPNTEAKAAGVSPLEIRRGGADRHCF